MARFVAVSGPSTTGKTTLVGALRHRVELKYAVFSPDFHEKISNELVSQGLFTDFTEITSDIDYLCIFLVKLIDCYNDYLDDMEYNLREDSLVILDTCWVDLAIYSILNMWYTRAIKPLQEDILSKLCKYDDRISRIYITKADDNNHPVEKFRLRGKMSTFRTNRPLELQFYEMAKHMKGVVPMKSADITEASNMIIEDLQELGYLL